MVGILALPDAFHFEVQEEAIGNGVILAIALAPHAADEAVLGQQILAKCAGVLVAPARMDDQPRRRLALLDRHGQHAADQFGAQRRRPVYYADLTKDNDLLKRLSMLASFGNAERGSLYFPSSASLNVPTVVASSPA